MTIPSGADVGAWAVEALRVGAHPPADEVYGAYGAAYDVLSRRTPAELLCVAAALASNIVAFVAPALRDGLTVDQALDALAAEVTWRDSP